MLNRLFVTTAVESGNYICVYFCIFTLLSEDGYTLCNFKIIYNTDYVLTLIIFLLGAFQKVFQLIVLSK